MKIATIGLDLSKKVFQVHSVDERGATVLCKQLRQQEVNAASPGPSRASSASRRTTGLTTAGFWGHLSAIEPFNMLQDVELC